MPTSAGCNRRQFAIASMAIAASRVLVREARAADDLPTADQFIPGKDKRLIMHNAKTGEIETPLGLLAEHAVTPKELLFVRNNQILPGTLSLDPAKDNDWQIELSGLLDRSASITLAELQ